MANYHTTCQGIATDLKSDIYIWQSGCTGETSNFIQREKGIIWEILINNKFFTQNDKKLPLIY